MQNALVSAWGNEAELDAIMQALWRFVRELPSGRALARRIEQRAEPEIS